VHGLVLLALLGSVGMRERGRRLALALVATGALFGFGVHRNAAVAWVLVVLGVAAFGLLVGRLASTEGELARQAEVSEAEKARRVVLEERARIARDLHDIVAHRMSLIAVQAETAPYRVPELSDPARAELAAIAGDARTALAETRVLLSVLRQEGEQARYAPQPGVEQLPELVAGSRRAGVAVTLCGDVPAERLSPAVSLAVYRIVQESLANAVRHAPGSTVRIELTTEDDQVVIGVHNTAAPGAATAAARPVTPGHGITGIHERVAALGGAVTLGPRADGGFGVDAVLPCVSRALSDDRDGPDEGGRR
jgi:signal transduction histidine kinase